MAGSAGELDGVERSAMTKTTAGSEVGVVDVVLVILRWLVMLAALTTIVFAVAFWPLAFLPAVMTALLYAIMLVVRQMSRTEAPAHPAVTALRAARRPEAPPSPQAAVEADEFEDEPGWIDQERQREHDEEVLTREESGLFKVAIPAAVALVVIGAVLAAIFLDWQFVALGGLLIFCYMLLIGGPIWVASIEEKEEAEHERVTGEESKAIH